MAGLSRSAVVTGVSGGIGIEIAAQLVASGWRVFGTVRTAGDADRLRKALGNAFEPLIVDVRDAAQIDAAVAQVAATLDGSRLGALVNNAGIVSAGPLLLQPIEQIEAQISINLLAPLALVRAFAPFLGTGPARRGPPGRIVNISSIAGKVALPMMGGYAISKHGLEAMSDTLRRELAPFGIPVITINAGSIRSNIFRSLDEAVDAYAHTPYAEAMRRFSAMMTGAQKHAWPPAAIAGRVVKLLDCAKPPSRLTVVRGKIRNWYAPRLLPAGRIDRQLQRLFALMPGDE